MEGAGRLWISGTNPRSRMRLEEVRARSFLVRNPSSGQNCDRFIPNRSSMDMDIARYLLTEQKKEKENPDLLSPGKEAYRRCLHETLLQNRTRIFSFKNKPPPSTNGGYEQQGLASHKVKPTKPRRHIPQSAERILDAPDMVDDYCLNLLDWGSSNVLAIALRNAVYLWNASNASTSELVTLDEEQGGPVTSVAWAPDGRHVATGLNNSHVQLWDSTSGRLVRTLRGVHQSRVGSLSWNGPILSTGGMDGMIVNNDMRVRSQVVQRYRGHRQEICGLKWSGSGQHLASGGNDNLLHIWDVSMASSRVAAPHQNQWLHRFDQHTAAVRALAWCPFRSNLLASGGGGSDGCIKFWNTHTGSCLKSVDTGSEVCSLIWSNKEKELLSSHGLTRNQLTLWKYPSMVKMAELTGHTSPVLFMAQSPDGCTVASAAAGDETLRLWNVFGLPQQPPKPAAYSGTLTGFNHIR